MSRIAALAGLFAGAVALGGCGFADSRAPLPEFMRMKELDQPPPEQPPDVRKLVREQLDVVFVAASYPRDVQVAPPRHEPRGPGWTSCVRAQLTSATGTPLGTQTYIVTIASGNVVDRRRAEADDTCTSEAYAPI
jgi:hypothetical protein